MRIDKLLSGHQSNRKSKVDEIGFIVPHQLGQHFGKIFKTLEGCLAYADENDIPYTKERGPFGMDAYLFPMA